MRRFVVAAMLLVGVATAQDQPPTPAPVETGRTFALGGNCQKILIAADQQHALTVGSHGDLCWWDLERREVLRSIAPRERYVSAVALHPTRALAAVCWTKGSHGDDAPVSGVDLETGDVTTWLPGRFDGLQFDASGRQLAVLRAVDDTPARELLQFDVDALPTTDLDAATLRQGDAKYYHGLRFVDGRAEGDPTASYAQPTKTRSPDGAHEASILGRAVLTSNKLSIDGQTFGLPCPETRLEHVRITDSGLAIAADQQGELHFVTPDGAMQLRAPHRGDALNMVFSPDGRHLAVHGLGAVRVVALDGSEKLQLQGSHVTVPGDAGGEFRIFARHRSWRFDSGSRREVGESVTWQEPAMPMVLWLPGGWHDAVRGGLTSPFRTGAVTMVDDAPWFAGSNSRTDLFRWTAHGWNKATTGPQLVSGPLRLTTCGDRVLLVTCSTALDDDSTSSTVTSFDLAGHETWRWKASGFSDWAVPDPARRRLWLGHDDQVLSLDLFEHSTITHHPERAWLAADLLPDGALLASDGQGLLVVDPETFEERHRWPNPDGWKSIDVLTASPDGRHVAIAHRDDVRILRLP